MMTPSANNWHIELKQSIVLEALIIQGCYIVRNPHVQMLFIVFFSYQSIENVSSIQDSRFLNPLCLYIFRG